MFLQDGTRCERDLIIQKGAGAIVARIGGAQ